MYTSTAEDFAGFLSARRVIVGPISSLSAMYFVYGFYVLLFGTCIHMMCRRPQASETAPNNRLYFSLTVALFTFSTLYVASHTVNLIRSTIISFNTVKTGDYREIINFTHHDVGKTVSYSLESLLPVFLKYVLHFPTVQVLLIRSLISIAADYMLIHRCYLIWGSKKRVAVPFIVASVLINASGLAGSILVTMGVRDSSIESNFALYVTGQGVRGVTDICNAIVNSIITLLTAGRIWWIHRQVRAHGIHSTDSLLDSVTRIILESGIIYPAFTIANMIMANSVTLAQATFNFYPLAIMSAGIAPTLIMVRAKLGKNVESLQHEVSSIRFMSRPAPREGTMTRLQTQLQSTGSLSITVATIQGESPERGSLQKEATSIV
ncbi:hypothetical protein Moror_640 [Moniliophthora roreri MCA 2997]|uniref:Uncharacterized protein n=1 Tax=Moniliophthora roreri (strain MCA 2997) TaxID=1381753 RepID=V2WVZ4_MONRO|nr:hypothetical protein Moror_640 [Moniliophthora roreri MCA 2997]